MNSQQTLEEIQAISPYHVPKKSLSKKRQEDVPITLPSVNNGRVEIGVFGVLGDSFYQESITETQVIAQLQQVEGDTPITIMLNSPGGDMLTGLTIYNYITQKMQGRDIECHVLGEAASAATLVLLACEKRIIPAAAMVMIHEPWTVSVGNYREMEKTVKMLKRDTKMIAELYAKHLAMPLGDIDKAMREETWYYGAEAVQMGFGTDGGDQDMEEEAASAKMMSLGFSNIPADAKSRFYEPSRRGMEASLEAAPPAVNKTTTKTPVADTKQEIEAIRKRLKLRVEELENDK